MLHRTLEFLLGLDKGFLDREGKLHLSFNPDWPGGTLWLVLWTLALTLAAVGLVWLLVRLFRRPSHGRSPVVPALVCVGGALAVTVTFSYLYLGQEKQRWIGVWNCGLGAGALALIIYVYSREGRSAGVRLVLATLRLLVLAFVLVLLNRPILTLGTTRTEPSILAVLIDDTISMSVPDATAGGGASAEPQTRLKAVSDLLTGDRQALLKDLARRHILKFYRFDSTAHPIAGVATKGQGESDLPADQFDAKPAADANGGANAAAGALDGAAEAIGQIKAEGQTTQVVSSVRAVLDELQGQRVAGVVILTDGRDTPAEPLADALSGLKNYGVRLYPIPVGSEQAPRNIEVEPPDVQDSAFVGDVVNVKVKVRATGYEAGHPVRLVLKNPRTGDFLRGPDGQPVDLTVRAENDKAFEVELPFKASEKGKMDFVVEAIKQPGEIDESDNVRPAQVTVVDSKINVLYVDGYPRWEYRYVKNEMIRDPNVNISCILQSADRTFAQEGSDVKGFRYFPYKEFPNNMEQLMETDVVVFGDVDPRAVSDAQLQLIKEFVSQKHGGFAMIAGPKFAPQAFRNTAIEDLLPVSIARVQGGYPVENLDKAFRPLLTPAGEASSIFRFFPEKARNDKYLKEEIQPLFWYCQGVTAKPGVGQVFAEHPVDSASDGHRAPIVVVGQFGKGRTLFSAIDDTWRWRYYTGEGVFDTYWVQTFRYLARSKKLGTHNDFRSLRPIYTLGDKVTLTLNVMDQTTLQQLGDQIDVDIEDADGHPVRREKMTKQEGQPDTYAASFAASKVGRYTARLAPLAVDQPAEERSYDVIVPRLELSQPQTDRSFLGRLVSEAGMAAGDPHGSQVVELADARTKLAGLIPSAAVHKIDPTNEPLWDVPLALAIFVLLLTAEWVIRKAYGML